MSTTEPDPSAPDWALLAFLTLCAVGAGVLELLVIPFYVGTVLILAPFAFVFAVAGNVLLPRLGYRLVGSTVGAVLPFLGWLIPILALAVVTRPEGDVLVLGAGWQEKSFYGVILGGALAGTVSIVMLTGSTQRRTPAPPSKRPAPRRVTR